MQSSIAAYGTKACTLDPDTLNCVEFVELGFFLSVLFVWTMCVVLRRWLSKLYVRSYFPWVMHKQDNLAKAS